MLLQVAQWNDILPILRDNFSIWSRGMSRSQYHAFLCSQLKDRWLRRHFRYLVYKVDDNIAASCKIYELDFVVKGQTLNFACISAVYSQIGLRFMGFAKRMLYSVIDDCKRRGVDGLILFSAIDKNFYETFGFTEIGGYDLLIYLPENETDFTEAGAFSIDEAARLCGFDLEISKDRITQLARYHRRWLSRQPYGIERTEDYFSFKFAREKFLTEHSRLNRPQLKVLSCSLSKGEIAYAIIEIAGEIMRVLEVVGSESGRGETWSKLFDLAKALKLRFIRGWEALLIDCAPGFTSFVSMPQYEDKFGKPKIVCYERDWGKPMILPISGTAERLSEVFLSTFPCPLLELDHF